MNRHLRSLLGLTMAIASGPAFADPHQVPYTESTTQTNLNWFIPPLDSPSVVQFWWCEQITTGTSHALYGGCDPSGHACVAYNAIDTNFGNCRTDLLGVVSGPLTSLTAQGPVEYYSQCTPSSDACPADSLQALYRNNGTGGTFTCTRSISDSTGIPMGDASQCPNVGPITSPQSPPPGPLTIASFRYSDGFASPISYDGQTATFTCGGWWDDAPHPVDVAVSTTPGFYATSSSESLTPNGDASYFGSSANGYPLGPQPQTVLSLVADCSRVSPGETETVTYTLSGDTNTVPRSLNLTLIRPQ